MLTKITMDPPKNKICGKGTHKINTNSGDVRLRVSIVGKPEEKARFTNTRISNEEEFEQIIAVLGEREVSDDHGKVELVRMSE